MSRRAPTRERRSDSAIVEDTIRAIGLASVLMFALADGRVLWRVRCKHCGHHPYHGRAEGRREAHCRADAVQRAGVQPGSE